MKMMVGTTRIGKIRLRDIHRKFKSILISSLVLNIPATLLAAEVVQHSDDLKVRAKISASKINRLHFTDNPFVQVIGDESKYNLIADERGTNLFLTSKVPAGETIELSLIDAAGKVTDLSLIASNIEGQAIRIIDDKLALRSATTEIARMLTSMINDERDKYYVQEIRRKLRGINIEGKTILDVTQDRIYRFADLTGARLVVKNNNARRETVELKGEDFSMLFEGSKAVSIRQKLLPARASNFVYVITQGGNNDK